MSLLIRWYHSNIGATPEQVKIFFFTMPIFLVIGFLISKNFMLVSLGWCIIYFMILVSIFADASGDKKSAFPYASKYPKANAAAHSFYFSWAFMGLCWLSINTFLSAMFL